MSIVSRPIFIVGAIAVVITVAVVTVLSLTGGDSTPSRRDTASANVVILLDRSIAMEGPFSGNSKFEAAIEVISKDILDQQLTHRQNLAFRLYGGSCDGDNSELAVGFGEDDTGIIQDALRGVAIGGEATLVGGVTEISGDFSGLVTPEATVNRVIIVAGSGESCGGDLTAALTRLRDLEIAVDLIGLDFSSGQIEAIRRAAATSGAQVSFVNTKVELTRELPARPEHRRRYRHQHLYI